MSADVIDEASDSSALIKPDACSNKNDTSPKLYMESIRFGCWNINGLRDYKQKQLLLATVAAQLDILALCETHLGNEEELVDWLKEIAADGEFV